MKWEDIAKKADKKKDVVKDLRQYIERQNELPPNFDPIELPLWLRKLLDEREKALLEENKMLLHEKIHAIAQITGRDWQSKEISSLELQKEFAEICRERGWTLRCYGCNFDYEARIEECNISFKASSHLAATATVTYTALLLKSPSIPETEERSP